MESQLVQIMVSLLTGGIGGNLAGALLKQFSVGTLGTSCLWWASSST